MFGRVGGVTANKNVLTKYLVGNLFQFTIVVVERSSSYVEWSHCWCIISIEGD